MAQDSAPFNPAQQESGANAADATNAQLLNQQLGAVIQALGTSSDDTVAGLMAIASAITASIIGGTTGVTANRVLRAKGTTGFALQNSLVSIDDSGNMSGVLDLIATTVTLLSGGAIRTSTGSGNTLLFQAYDVDGASYTTFATLTADNTPTFDLATGVTKGGVGIATLNTNTWAQQQGFSLQTLTDAATISWNLQTQQTAEVTLGGNRTLDTPSNMVAGFTYVLFVVQDATGGRTLAYHADYLFPGGVDPVLSTAANAVDILTFISRGSKMYGVAQKGFA